MEFSGSKNLDDVGTSVSLFDHSAENHFRIMDAISKLSGETNIDPPEEIEIKRLVSSITFVRELHHYFCQPRGISFSCEMESKKGDGFMRQTELPRFSSIGRTPTESSDFVMNVGGSVWALDWCPKFHPKLDSYFNCEFVAVSAHPPDSCFHKMGVSLTGSGLIQIWCVPNINRNREFSAPSKKQKHGALHNKRLVDQQSKPERRRPKKQETEKLLVGATTKENVTQFRQPRGRPRKNLVKESDGMLLRCGKLVQNQDMVGSSLEDNVVLPRVVFCLAHDGKVAWDVKWRPEFSDCKFQHRLGYLAVLLGDGSLEVWDVPHPNIMKFIYSACHEDGSDPRFVKLKPIFRCSSLMCGDVKSIPLTVEWSPTPPSDCLLAGCHDGRVVLWKFSASDTCSDTRPLLSFIADTVPIRTVTWAPISSDQEASNVIATAGHGGLKFWDLRDPFRPLWGVALKKFIYSLDWPPDPRCIILSCDDGKMRLLSLVKAAYDAPVSEDGKASVGPKQQGLHEIYCSSSAIWSVHVSRLTGMVAYCCADGTVSCFQLTDKAVEKDPSRHRAPHFLCGSLDVSNSTFIVSTPPMQAALKKPSKDAPENPKSMREFLWKSNKERRSNSGEHVIHASSDVEPLDACYSEDPDSECGYSESSRALSPRVAGGNQASVCMDGGGGRVQGMEIEEGATREAEPFFPPKMVAMHRVRWNLNRGSERWLCTGGAAGLVRCRQIMLP